MSAQFWDRFAAEHWERASMAVPRAFEAPLAVDQAQVFAAVVGGCAANAGTLWLRGAREPTPPPEAVPACDRPAPSD